MMTNITANNLYVYKNIHYTASVIDLLPTVCSGDISDCKGAAWHPITCHQKNNPVPSARSSEQ